MCWAEGGNRTKHNTPSSLGRLGKDLQGKLNTPRQLISHIWHSARQTYLSWGDLQKCGGRDLIARDDHYQAPSTRSLLSEARCFSNADLQRSLPSLLSVSLGLSCEWRNGSASQYQDLFSCFQVCFLLPSAEQASVLNSCTSWKSTRVPSGMRNKPGWLCFTGVHGLSWFIAWWSDFPSLPTGLSQFWMFQTELTHTSAHLWETINQ